MSYNNDDSLIFENSPLYDYLQSSDKNLINDFIDPEIPITMKSVVEKPLAPETKLEHSYKSFLLDYIFDEGWKNSQKKLYYQFSNRIIGHTLKNNLLNEYDASYIKAFAESNTFNDSNVHSSENILNQMFTQMSVLCITIGYALMRLIYVKSTADIMPSYLFVYGLDVLSLFMTILALMPVAIRFSSTGRLVGEIRKLETTFLALLTMFINSKKLLTKSYSFIHEMEILYHGYTFLNAPICRLEKGLYKFDSERRYADLRFEIYKSACSFLLATRKLSNHLLTLFPADINLQGIKNCYAKEVLHNVYSVPLSDREQILMYTDNLSLQSIKSVMEILNLHISEFMRIACLKFYTNHDLSGGVLNQVNPEILTELIDLIKCMSSNLQKSLNFHKYLTEKIKNFDEKCLSRKMAGSDVKYMHMLLHSLLGHLHTAFTSMSIHEAELEKQLELVENSETLSNYFVDALTTDLDLLKKNLAASQDCYNEIQRQINIFNGIQNPKKLEPDIRLNQLQCQSNEAMDIKITNVEQADIQDEVYEAFTTDYDKENKYSDFNDEYSILHHKETGKVLSELKNVISERAELMKKREDIAIQRRNLNNPGRSSSHLNDSSVSDEEEEREEVPNYKSDLIKFWDRQSTSVDDANLKESTSSNLVFTNNSVLEKQSEAIEHVFSDAHLPNCSNLMNARVADSNIGPNVANLVANMSRGLLTGLEETFANDSDLDSSNSGSDYEAGMMESDEYDDESSRSD